MFEGSKETEQATVTPPTFHGLENDLAEIIRSRIESRRVPIPESMPQNTFEAVKWFVRLFEGQKGGEAVREVRTSKGQKYWLWPYAERIKRLTRLFFKVDKDFQDTIIAAKEDGMCWRGEDLDFFMRVIDETEKMREFGVVAYRKKSLAQIRKLSFS